MTSDTNYIVFLGTAGARFMVIGQHLASGGVWLNLDGTEILVDPGPGCIVQTIKQGLEPEKLNAIILTHRHLDHSSDLNIMIEAMTRGGLTKRGQLFLPADALGCEPVVFSYLHDYLGSITLLEKGRRYSIGNISFITPVKHIHSVETYGMVFQTADHTLSYITDSRFFNGLLESYCGELIIINVVFLDNKPHTALPPKFPADHLSLLDAEQIIIALKPKVAILTHFGTRIWRANPSSVAEDISQRTGIRVLAAQDGMRFYLSEIKEKK